MWNKIQKTFKILLTSFIVIIVIYIGYSMNSSYNPPVSDHSDGHRFHNLDPKIKQTGLLSILKWRFTSKSEKWSDMIAAEFNDVPPERIFDDKIRVSFIGHATFLIQTQGLNIITDPLYSERCSPFTSKGPKKSYRAWNYF